MPEPPPQQPENDARQPFRLVVDVLATPEQVQELQEVIGEALCAAPGEHPGPCRTAWSIAYVGGGADDLDGSYGLDQQEAAFIREHLAQVPVWPRAEVDRDLGL
ncbi:hypothetical protein MO973_38015 [Paenibacillus sp. TRM 82003]|uniref:hypothetical protein n=1 Tax=Kineococcus sp. TRM81007 TaxID=2925831 RepID=UPI001F5A532D|nr:hypothetical protein [Kineococcus sp. TRM81007]MCI2237986.1 hypothetical protein [Kineococcus sp. TRM81007]MCI3926001.1 hypothetical protein [Paenibacillus sp. TRM 82003]